MDVFGALHAKYESMRMIWNAKQRVRELDEKMERERRKNDPYHYISLDKVPPCQKMDLDKEFKRLFDGGCLKCALPFDNNKYCAKWELERNEACKEILAKYYNPYNH